MDLACCHGERYDVIISALKVLPNNRVAKIFIVCLQVMKYPSLVSFIISQTLYSNEKPC